MVDALQNETTFTYDTENQDPLMRANMLTRTNPLDNTWEYEWDQDGNLTKLTNPLNEETEMTYDGNGNLLTITNALQQTVSTLTYTGEGLLASATDGRNNTTSFSYSNHGHLTKITDAANEEWEFDYDIAGNLLSVETPLGHKTEFTYNGFYEVATSTNPLGKTTHFDYDEMANLIEVKDANDNTVQFEWDKLQRLTAITDALENTITFSYDAESNLTLLKDPLDREYSWSYDDAFHTEEFEFPDQSKESYQYDANGNLTQLTNRANQEIEVTYDDANRRTQKVWKDTDDTVFTYTYDDANRRTGVTRVHDSTTQSSISYTYDAAGRIIGVTAEGRSIGYGYDGSQNLNLIEYPSGLEVHRSFDSRNLLSELEDGNQNIIAEYSRDADGRVTVRKMGNGLEMAYTYNAADWITKIELRETATPSNVLRSFEYGYDDVGNRLWVEYEDGTGDVYKYDATYQVVGVKYGVDNPQDGYDLATNPDRVVTYEYDAVGNRTTVVDDASSTVYTVNDLNQYTQVGSTSYTFSSRGDLIGDGTWTFGYDHEGRLISAEKSGTTISYQYDGVGRRIGKTVNGTSTEYVYSGDDLIEERDVHGAVIARYVYEMGIDRPVKVVRSSGGYYFAQDALGNVVALTDSSGNVVEEYRYDIFGEPEILDGNGSPVSDAMTPLLFTGREYDSETGLYHYRTRAYSPEFGRFLQPDSIDFAGGDVNLYRYVGNSPIKYNDPFGKGWVLVVVVVLAVAGTYQIVKKVYHFIDDCGNALDHKEIVELRRQQMIENTTSETIEAYQQAAKDGYQATGDASRSGAEMPGSGMQGPAGPPTDAPSAAADMIKRGMQEVNK